MNFDPQKFEIMKEETAKRQTETIESYKRLNKIAKKGQILFTGSSLMEQFPITELAMTHELGRMVYNRGVGGFTTTTFIENIDTMLFDLAPKYVFINIGTNDLANSPDGTPWQEILENNYRFILEQIRKKLPETVVYLMAYYPMDDTNEELEVIRKAFGTVRTNETIKEASAIAKNLAEQFGFHYIDVNDGLTDEQGNLKKEFCKDAIHFYPDGYEVVYQNLRKYLEALV